MIELRGVTKTFGSGILVSRRVTAVDNVNLVIKQGKTTGLVGNSGCGKTTLSRMILGSVEADQGEIYYQGRALSGFDKKGWKQYRRQVQIIFQNPGDSFNPTQKIKESLLEPMKIQKLGTRKEQEEKVETVMELVGVPKILLTRYPHQLSGGEAQRLVLCRALTLNPQVLILDEPTSMLDVSVQAHIMNILKRLQQQLGLTYLFITHDLDLVSWMADELAVMNEGVLVEQGKTSEILEHPKEEYTRRLTAAFRCWEDADSKTEMENRSKWNV